MLFVHANLKYFKQSITVFTDSQGLPEQSVDHKDLVVGWDQVLVSMKLDCIQLPDS